MSPQQIIFYAFSAILLFAATMVVTSKNSVRAVLFLVLSFFACAALWLLLHAEFLAITLILVYVGAVLVLFLFVVMMLDVNTAANQAGYARYLPLGALVALLVIGMMITTVGGEWFGLEQMPIPQSGGEDINNIRAIGQILYTDYVYAFELAGVILLVAIIAAIALTFRGRREGTKGQKVAVQLAADKQDRIRIMRDLK